MVEGRFPDLCETQPELLAQHYAEAGLSARAIPYWQRAGRCTVERSANLEAGAHLATGLEVLATLPDAIERAQQELAMQTTLGSALFVTKGQASPEVLHPMTGPASSASRWARRRSSFRCRGDYELFI